MQVIVQEEKEEEENALKEFQMKTNVNEEEKFDEKWDG